MTLNDSVLELIRRNQKVSLEIDAETYRLMSELAASAGVDIPTLLKKLAIRFKREGWETKMLIIGFLKGIRE